MIECTEVDLFPCEVESCKTDLTPHRCNVRKYQRGWCVQDWGNVISDVCIAPQNLVKYFCGYHCSQAEAQLMQLGTRKILLFIYKNRVDIWFYRIFMNKNRSFKSARDILN
jgi:hypothetical protein